MCTSIVVNKKKTIVGFNLDLINMDYRITSHNEGVFIEVYDDVEGWLPLFGGNSAGDFVGMPTCWPFDERSNPSGNEINVINIDIDLLLQKKSFNQIKEFVETEKVCSIPGLTFMSALSDSKGNVLYVVPGQGIQYFEKPEYKIMTNFSPFKMDSEQHPWMGYDRYLKAEDILSKVDDDFDVKECFDLLGQVSQKVCPTVVSMVYDVTDRIIYWCENRNYDSISERKL